MPQEKEFEANLVDPSEDGGKLVDPSEDGDPAQAASSAEEEVSEPALKDGDGPNW